MDLRNTKGSILELSLLRQMSYVPGLKTWGFTAFVEKNATRRNVHTCGNILDIGMAHPQTVLDTVLARVTPLKRAMALS